MAGSKPPPSRVAFTESEITEVDGVRVREERYVTRNVDRIIVVADEMPSPARSDARRCERYEVRAPSPPQYGYMRRS